MAGVPCWSVGCRSVWHRSGWPIPVGSGASLPCPHRDGRYEGPPGHRSDNGWGHRSACWSLPVLSQLQCPLFVWGIETVVLVIAHILTIFFYGYYIQYHIGKDFQCRHFTPLLSQLFEDEMRWSFLSHGNDGYSYYLSPLSRKSLFLLHLSSQLLSASSSL